MFVVVDLVGCIKGVNRVCRGCIMVVRILVIIWKSDNLTRSIEYLKLADCWLVVCFSMSTLIRNYESCVCHDSFKTL